jgi:hypothetical protein
MKNPFTEHPNSVGETYFQHMRNALRYSIILGILSLIVFIHSVFPFWFKTLTGDKVEKLNKEMKRRKNSK